MRRDLRVPCVWRWMGGVEGGEKKHILCLFPRDSDSVGLSWGQKSTILIKTCNSDADGSCLTLCTEVPASTRDEALFH